MSHIEETINVATDPWGAQRADVTLSVGRHTATGSARSFLRGPDGAKYAIERARVIAADMLRGMGIAVP